ncbi:probable serine carboxypeptidase CPVL [Littorina saxatilis]|uniref:Carboxypeptidase n=1 Tax=Littorina saxatilis TaxID=31220 RepID=A0AAN9G8U8_9CAEN
MKKVLLLLEVLCAFAASPVTPTNPFRAVYPQHYPPMAHNGVDPGQPLFLTPYLQKGDIQKAVSLSQVTSLPGWSRKSYAGYITVNETHQSNTFFWFFPAQMNPVSAPVLMWLQGGPGGSSLFGLFDEHGPFFIDKHIKLRPRNITWNQKYSMLYVDNPVGTGFSFTKDDAGYVTNEEEVGRDLYSFLVQFFQIYSEYQSNDFYITGESYAGKYVPAISYKIHMENQGHPKVKINFKGMAIGDGLCDPITMLPKYADFMFNVGLIDEPQARYVQRLTNNAANSIAQKKYLEAFKLFDVLWDDNVTQPNPSFAKMSGLFDDYNFLRTQGPAQFNYYGDFLADPVVRRAIHVGNLTFNGGTEVYNHLTEDFLQSVKPWIAVIMDNYKVMIYNGQLDIIIAVPLTEAWLQTVRWSGLVDYKNAERRVWKVTPSDTEVAGWVRQVKNFYQVIVRSAGHILPYDQPARAYDMIQRFVEGKSFA